MKKILIKLCKSLWEDKMVLTGVIILLFFTIIAVLAPFIAPYDPHKIVNAPYLKPDSNHWLGTNDVGQDIFSEMIFGSRISLTVGVVAALAVTLIGSTVGILSGYFRGGVDQFLTFLTNVAMTIPSLTLTILLVAFVEAGVGGMILAICITSWAGTARVIRSRVLQIRELPYIQIEKILGAKHWYIMLKHIFPNIWDIVLTRCAMSVGGAMMMETSLSFLGLGTFSSKSWGNVLHFAFFRNGVINNYWWWYLPPILCISVCMLGFMLLTYHNREKGSLIAKK